MGFLATYTILVAFWIFMSGLFDVWYLGLGILCCALVAHMSGDLLFKKFISGTRLKETRAFVGYLPWLLYQIYLANIYVVKVSLGRNLDARIFPHIIKFKTRLKSEMALTAFANSITLTPGTITVDIKDGYFYVHALDKSLADALPGEMEDRIARIYGES